MRIFSSTSISAYKSEIRPHQFDQRQPLLGQHGLEQVEKFRLVQDGDVALQSQHIAVPICAKNDVRMTPSSP